MSAGIKELLDQMESILEEIGLGSLENWLDGLNFDLDISSWKYCTSKGIKQVKQLVPGVGYRFAYLHKCTRKNLYLVLSPDNRLRLNNVILDGGV